MRYDLTDQRFGLWHVITYKGDRKWLCRCDCGNERLVHGPSLTKGVSKSCGCQRPRQAQLSFAKHGLADKNNPEYKAWCQLRSRCLNHNGKNWAEYGGRGITVDPRWDDYPTFLADMGPRPSPKHSINRIDNDGPYSPENCEWATIKTQRRNTRVSRYITHNGETLTVAEWAERLGIKATILHGRLHIGWSEEDTLTIPARYRRSPFST